MGRDTLVTATKPCRTYCFGILATPVALSRTVTCMISDIHNLQLPLLCQLSKSTPNILWSVGTSLHNQFWQVGRGNPAVMAARISFNSVLERHSGKTSRAAGIANSGSRARARSGTAVREETAARV
jgi:hypothetical protein